MDFMNKNGEKKCIIHFKRHSYFFLSWNRSTSLIDREILIRINYGWARLPELLVLATHCSLYCPTADVTGALKVEPADLETGCFFCLLRPSDIWTLIPHKLSQHHPQSGWREIAASPSYLFIYLFIYLQVASLWLYLSCHLFVPYDLHCVQLLLLQN